MLGLADVSKDLGKYMISQRQKNEVKFIFRKK